jgi:hypothetical protein
LNSPLGSHFILQEYGHTITFVLEGKKTNLAFARAILYHLTRNGHQCTVLDIDALYSSNSDYVFAPLSERQAQAVEVLVPNPESDLESSIAALLASESSKTIIIDSLNSLYHLFSTGGSSLRGRKLAFVMACFSYISRTERRAVLITMYQRESTTRIGGGRQISGLSDHTISAELGGNALTLRYNRGYPQSGGIFYLPIL